MQYLMSLPLQFPQSPLSEYLRMKNRRSTYNNAKIYSTENVVKNNIDSVFYLKNRRFWGHFFPHYRFERGWQFAQI